MLNVFSKASFAAILTLQVLFLFGCNQENMSKNTKIEPVFILTINSGENKKGALESVFLNWSKLHGYTLKKGGLTSSLPNKSFFYYVYQENNLVFSIHSIKVNIAGEIYVYSSQHELITKLESWLNEEGYSVEVKPTNKS